MANDHDVNPLVGQALDPGQKRKGAPNQDAIGMLLPSIWNKRAPLYIVADGMGGQQDGALAAKYVIDEMTAAYKRQSKNPHQSIKAGINAAHKKIRKHVAKQEGVRSMGAAMVAAVVKKEEIYIANVGDARIYVINQDHIKHVSYDHSFVMEQVREGIITREEAATHPRRNVLTMSITSQREIVEPFIDTIPYKEGDYLLLCSDGLWGTVSETQIQDVVLELPPQEAADKLVKMANMNQGPDNISVIIVKL